MTAEIVAQNGNPLQKLADKLHSAQSIKAPVGVWAFASAEPMDLEQMFHRTPAHIRHKSGNETVIWCLSEEPRYFSPRFATYNSITKFPEQITINDTLTGFNLPIKVVLEGDEVAIDGEVQLIEGTTLAAPITGLPDTSEHLKMLNEARSAAGLEPMFTIDPETFEGLPTILDAMVAGIGIKNIYEAVRQQSNDSRLDSAALVERRGYEELAQLIRTNIPPHPKKLNDYTRLMLVAKRIRVFENQHHTRYAELESGEFVLLGATKVTDAVRSILFAASNTFPKDTVIKSAIAMQPVNRITTARRVAYVDNVYYIDIGDNTGEAYAIEAGRWWVEKSPPVRFLRSPSAGALPRIDENTDADVEKLFDVINIDNHGDEILVLTWLAEALRPETPFPALQLSGDAGSGKSTTARILRDVIDPRKSAHLQRCPTDENDLAVAIASNHVAAFDNMSALPGKAQDLFCMVATGATQIKRKLFTDADEVEVSNHAPCILNGILELATRPDLLSRTIPVTLAKPEIHIKVSAINNRFVESKGEILAGLLELFAEALDRLGKVGDSTHRLSDFDQLGRAIALVMHGDEQVFVDAFESKTAIKSASALEGSVAGQAVLEYFRQRPYCNELRGSSGVVMNTVMPDSRHYNNPRFFKNDLIRVKNELADVGFEVTHEEKRAKVYDLVIKRAQTDDAVATISSQLKEALRAFANMSDTDRSTVIAALEHEQGLAEIQGLLDKELADSRLNDTRAKLDKAAAILGGIK